MAMTMPEMVEFFGERTQGARRGMDAARTTGNYQLAALNCRQAFKCRLMKSLIMWRMGTDPSDSLSAVVAGFADDWATVSAIGDGGAKRADVPAERVAFAAYLTGQPVSIVNASEGLESDRLLDLVLGNWLFDRWNEELWQQGLEQLRAGGSDLGVQTYELYKAVVDSEGSHLPALLQEGEKLFARRKSDGFFRGSDQTEGGGDDNDVTVDYRLAALLRRAGFEEATGIHPWKW